MDYCINLKSAEPCDVYLVNHSNVLTAVVVESNTVYSQVLGGYDSDDFTLVCGKHSFARANLIATVVDDFALIDGVACYTVELPEKVQEVIKGELYCG